MINAFKWVSNPLNWIPFIIFVLGLVVMRVDAKMSHKFGMSFDGDAALGLTCISIASGFLLVVVVQQWRKGNVNVAKCLGGAWVLVFAFNVISNMGVATSVRLAETQNSNLQKATHNEHIKSREEAEARLAWAQGQLKTLITNNGWAATVTADGLRQQVADLRVARASESKLGGCGPKCRGIENQISSIQGKIAVAEQRQNLDKQISATKAVLAKARNTLAESDGGVSLVANQASLYSRWTVGWFGKDGESVGAVRNSNELLGIFMAFVIAVSSVALTLAGAWPHLMAVRPQLPPGNDGEDGTSAGRFSNFATSSRDLMLSPRHERSAPQASQARQAGREPRNTDFAEAVRRITQPLVPA